MKEWRAGNKGGGEDDGTPLKTAMHMLPCPLRNSSNSKVKKASSVMTHFAAQ